MRVLLAAALAAATLAAAPPALAQDVPNIIAPLRVESDQNGVNLVSGKLILDMPTLSVPAAPNLSFDRVQNAAPYVTGTSNAGDDGGQSSYSLHTGGGSSEAFKCTGVDCTSVTGTGSTFAARQYRQAGSGALWHFNLKHADAFSGATRYIQYYASHVDYPNGERIDYAYQTYASGDFLNRVYYRPTSITSNLGFFIALTYQGSTFGTPEWSRVATATLYASAAPSVPLKSLTYSGNAITETAGSSSRTFTCAGCANQLGAELETSAGSLALPGESAAATQVSQHPAASVVGSVVKDGVSWTYSYTNLRAGNEGFGYVWDKMIVDGPNGYHAVYDTTGANVRNIIVKSTDSLGRATSYEYDGAYRPTKIILPELNATSVGYDGYGNIVAGTTSPKPGSGLAPVTASALYPDTCDASGNPVLCYRPTWSKDALGRQTDYLYNAAGQLVEQTDPADQNGLRKKTFVTYDASSGISRRSVVRMCFANSTCGTNQEFRTEYLYWGNTLLPSRERRIDSYYGRTRDTNFTYDPAGRLISTDGPLAGADDAVYTRYDAYGRKSWEIGALSEGQRTATRFTYRDSDDKLLYSETGTLPDENSTSLAVFSRSDFTYDAGRNPVRQSLSASGTTFQVADKSWDDRGRLVCSAVRMNTAAFGQAPGACAFTTQGSQGPDRITRNEYDAASQLTKIQKAYGTPIQQDYARYEYTANGKPKAVIDANGNRAELTYDGFDRQRRWIFPSNTPGVANPADYEEYGYDLVGNRTSLRKRDGSTLAYQYDALNRVIRKIVPERAGLTAAQTRDVYYDYNNALGLQTKARFETEDGYGVTFYYDMFGLPTTTLLNMNGYDRYVSYYHDDAGNLWRLSHPDGAHFYYYYDAAGRVKTVLDGPATGTNDYVVRYWYDAAGNRSGVVRGADGLGFNTVFYRDPIERPAIIANDLPAAPDLSIELAYNPAGQIVQRTYPNDTFAWTGHYNVSRGYAVNGLNQYTQAGPATFAYDANGNLTSDGTTSYTYDVENRLVASSNGAALVYDPLGRLFEVSGAWGATQFLYDRDRIVAEYAGSTLLRRYVHGPGADEPVAVYEGSGLGLATRRYTMPDERGSIIALINADGSPSVYNIYDSWGIPGADNAGRFQYTGQAWLPELGMYYYKARIYSPTLGRFLQTDPIGYEDQINLYAYVENDPINQVDPSGLQTILRSNPGDSDWLADKKQEIRDGIVEGLWEGEKKAYFLLASISTLMFGPQEAPAVATFGAARSLMAGAFAAGRATSGRTSQFIGSGGAKGALSLFRQLVGDTRAVRSGNAVVGRLGDGNRVIIRTQIQNDIKRTTVEVQRQAPTGTKIMEHIKVRFDERIR